MLFGVQQDFARPQHLLHNISVLTVVMNSRTTFIVVMFL